MLYQGSSQATRARPAQHRRGTPAHGPRTGETPQNPPPANTPQIFAVCSSCAPRANPSMDPPPTPPPLTPWITPKSPRAPLRWARLCAYPPTPNQKKTCCYPIAPRAPLRWARLCAFTPLPLPPTQKRHAATL